MVRWYKKEPVSTTPEWARLEEECSQEYCQIPIRCMRAFHWVLSEECQKMESGRLTKLQAERAIRDDVEGFFYGATTPSQVLELFLKHRVFITATEKDGDREIEYITEKSIADSVHAYKKAQEKGREVQQKGKENKEKREAKKAKDAERKRREYAKSKEKDKAERAKDAERKPELEGLKPELGELEELKKQEAEIKAEIEASKKKLEWVGQLEELEKQKELEAETKEQEEPKPEPKELEEPEQLEEQKELYNYADVEDWKYGGSDFHDKLNRFQKKHSTQYQSETLQI